MSKTMDSLTITEQGEILEVTRRALGYLINRSTICRSLDFFDTDGLDLCDEYLGQLLDKVNAIMNKEEQK